MLGCTELGPPISEPQFFHLYQEGLGQIISKEHSTHRQPEYYDSNKDAAHAAPPIVCSLP